MCIRRFAFASVATLILALAPLGGADAQTKLTMGKVIGGDGFHIPTYVALNEGFFKAEGPRRHARRIAGELAGFGRAVRQSRLRADPLGRRAGGAERRQNHLHRR